MYPQSEDADIITRILSKALSLLFAFVVYLRSKAYDLGLLAHHTLPGFVYSVGNIAVGGTGKTPVVISIVKLLQRKGSLPVILTRGYGSGLKKNDWIVLLNGALAGGNTKPSQIPDEARLQSVECPGIAVIAGANRFAAAKAYLKTFAKGQEPSHWVLDDGFQHRRIRRDIDIVLLDKTNPIGSGWLLPFGFLREPLSSLKRATHVFLTGNGVKSPDIARAISDVKSEIQITEIFTKSETIEIDVTGEIKFSEINRDNIFVIAGIARPERFLQDLKSDGIVPAKKLFLPDHHSIDAKKLSESLDGSSAVITTAKDYWRNPEVFASVKIPVFIKKIEFNLPDSLVNQLF